MLSVVFQIRDNHGAAYHMHITNQRIKKVIRNDMEQYWLFVILIGIIVVLAVKDLNDKY